MIRPDGPASPGAGGALRPRHRRIELTATSVAAAASLLALAVVGLWAARRSSRVLGWVAAATLIASLLAPLVNVLARHIRRGLAVLVVALTSLLSVGGLAWLLVGDLQHEFGRLQRAAPAAAVSVEQSERFGEAARRFDLAKRLDGLMADIPGRLAGGEGAAAVRSAATRGITLLITLVLALFLIADGERIVRAGLRQIRPDDRRRRVSITLHRAYHRAWRYLTLMLAKAVVLGVVAYIGYRAAAIPAASVLALTVAAASLVPYLGIVLIGLPIAALAGGLEVSLAWGLTVLGVHIVAQWVDVLLVRRAVQPRSVSVGPAASLIAVVVGLDVYGLGGALVALPAMILLLALLDEWLPEEDQSQVACEPARTGPVLP